jgi:hypothetical protein
MRATYRFPFLLVVLLLASAFPRAGLAQAPNLERWTGAPIPAGAVYIPGQGTPPVFAPSKADAGEAFEPASETELVLEDRGEGWVEGRHGPAPAQPSAEESLLAIEAEEARQTAQEEKIRIKKSFKLFEDALDVAH